MDYLEKFEKLGVKIPNILLPKAGTDYSKYAVPVTNMPPSRIIGKELKITSAILPPPFI